MLSLSNSVFLNFLVTPKEVISLHSFHFSLFYINEVLSNSILLGRVEVFRITLKF